MSEPRRVRGWSRFPRGIEARTFETDGRRVAGVAVAVEGLGFPADREVADWVAEDSAAPRAEAAHSVEQLRLPEAAVDAAVALG